MEEDGSEIARDAIFEAIENQIRDGNPPVTKETYDRLASEGHSHEETLKLIGCALSVEIFGALKNKEVFNEERYKKNLNNLPDLPWTE